MVVQKTKEVGVRKVLGAGVQNIVWLFGKEFTYLLLIAFVIAAPLAWWLMSNWLETFAYRIQIRPGIFILTILITFAVAVTAAGYKSIMAALINPVKSLRSE